MPTTFFFWFNQHSYGMALDAVASDQAPFAGEEVQEGVPIAKWTKNNVSASKTGTNEQSKEVPQKGAFDLPQLEQSFANDRNDLLVTDYGRRDTRRPAMSATSTPSR
jgi:hypothetical protein